MESTVSIATNSDQPRATKFALSARGWIVVCVLFLDALVTAGLFLSRLREGALIRDAVAGRLVTDADLANSDALINSLTQLHLAVFLAAAVFFLVWIYSANKRAHNLAPVGMRFSPWASVLWFFAPFANLIYPLRAVREIWRASDPTVDRTDPVAWQSASVTWLLSVWWVAWIGTNLASRLVPTRLTGRESVQRLIEISATAGWISAAIAVSALLACAVVVLIESRLRASEDRIQREPRVPTP
jgi:hypothetical protein